MGEIAKILKVPQQTQHSFSSPDRNYEAVEDYAVKKVMNTVEGTIEKVPVNSNDIVNKAYADSIAGGLPTNPNILGSLIVNKNITSTSGSYYGYGGTLTGITATIPDLSGSYIPQGQLPVGSIPTLTSYIPQGTLPVGSIPSLSYLPQGILPVGSVNYSSVLPQGILPIGSIPTISLDLIGNPAASKSFAMNGKDIEFLFTTGSIATGHFQIEGTGNFAGDLVHIHQHTGAPGAGTDLLHLEAASSNVIPLRVSGAGQYDIISGNISTTNITATGSITANTFIGSSSNYIPQGLIAVGSIPTLTAYIPQGQLVVGSLPTNYIQVGSVTGSYVAAPHPSGTGSHTPMTVNVIYSTAGSPAANTVPEGTIYIQYT